MDNTHAAVGVSATSASFALTTLLTGFHGLDGGKAAALSWLIVTGAGGLWLGVAWYVKWRYPTAPALPGELVQIPPGAPPVQVAQMPPPEVPPPAPAVVAAALAAPPNPILQVQGLHD